MIVSRIVVGIKVHRRQGVVAETRCGSAVGQEIDGEVEVVQGTGTGVAVTVAVGRRQGTLGTELVGADHLIDVIVIAVHHQTHGSRHSAEPTMCQDKV